MSQLTSDTSFPHPPLISFFLHHIGHILFPLNSVASCNFRLEYNFLFWHRQLKYCQTALFNTSERTVNPSWSEKCPKIGRFTEIRVWLREEKRICSFSSSSFVGHGSVLCKKCTNGQWETTTKASDTIVSPSKAATTPTPSKLANYFYNLTF
jgi:hypothetical protein